MARNWSQLFLVFWFIVAAKIQQPISIQGTARRSIRLHLTGDRIRYLTARSTPSLIVAVDRGETMVFEAGTALSNMPKPNERVCWRQLGAKVST